MLLEEDADSLYVLEHLRPIPPLPSPCLNAPTVTLLASRVQPARASALLRVLSTIFPLRPHFHHLKRICRAGDTDDNDATPPLTVLLAPRERWDSKRADIEEIETKYKLKPFDVAVPARAPDFREEFEAWSPLWPLNYRPQGKEEKKEPWSVQERRLTFSFMKDVMNSTISETKDDCGGPVIFVHQAVASERWEMVITVAEEQREGEDSSQYGFGLDHAIIRGIEMVARKWKHKEAQKEKVGRDAEGEGEGEGEEGYLCTGMHVYLEREPCVMCAMALVHSRVRRVIFAQTLNSELGGLAGAKVHCEPMLNHRYEAYHLPWRDTVHLQPSKDND